MEVGFERACVDVIAARAAVSKATVYNHFQDKSALFIASFSEEADAMRAEFLACLAEPTNDLEAALRCIGEKLVRVLLSPAFVSLYRHASAACPQFPELGQVLFERGPTLVQDQLGAYLKRWEEKGKLSIGDQPRVAAVHFSGLCQGDLNVRAQLGMLGPSGDKEIRQTVERGVKAFIRAYGAAPQRAPTRAKPVAKRPRSFTSKRTSR